MSMITKSKVAVFFLLCPACGGASQDLSAGDGVVLSEVGEETVVSINAAEVPWVTECVDGEVIQRTAEGWDCAAVVVPEVNDLAIASLPCDDGELAVYTAGVWECGAPASAAGGDITEVMTPADSGLTGGAASGAVTLEVAFGGSGTATNVARSDHYHQWSAIRNIPPSFEDGVDDDALGGLSCMDQQLPTWSSTSVGWVCADPPSGTGAESDPTVNSLGKTASLDGCSPGEVAKRGLTGWECTSDEDSLAAMSGCPDQALASWSAASSEWTCREVAEPIPGDGLIAGTVDGELAVAFGGVCPTGEAACSDHTHDATQLDAVLAAGNSAGNQRISNLAAPVSANDAATKGYVDALGGGSGGGGSAIAACCGAICSAALTGWLCLDIPADGKLAVQLPDQRATFKVPDTGDLVLVIDGGAGDVTLSNCPYDWQVCSGQPIEMTALCGHLGPSAPAGWSCTHIFESYFVTPGTKGMLHFSNLDPVDTEETDLADTVELLGDDGVLITDMDCPNPTPQLPNVCYR